MKLKARNAIVIDIESLLLIAERHMHLKLFTKFNKLNEIRNQFQ